MRKNYYLLLTVVGLLMASCSTTETLYRYDESTANYMSPKLSPMIITPTIADLQISNTKVVDSITYENRLSKNDILDEKSPYIEYIKNNTICTLVRKHNADVIVSPTFTIKTSEDFERITVIVSGYTALYKNLRNVTIADSLALRINNIPFKDQIIQIVQPK